LIEHGLTSPPTQYRLYGRRRSGERNVDCVGCKFHWRRIKRENWMD